MRKIQTQAEIDKKKRKNQLLVGGVMIGLLVLSIVGYSFTSGNSGVDNSKISERGIDFFKQNGVWVAQIDGSIFGFQNLPSQVSDIDVDVTIGLGQYSGQVLYFVNPNEGVNEVLTNIGGYILRYQEACLGNESCEGDLPVKDCNSNLIIFVEGNESKVYQNESCIFIVGDSLKGTDAFLYKVLGVI